MKEKQKYWITEEGRKIFISEMSSKNLISAINMLKNKVYNISYGNVEFNGEISQHKITQFNIDYANIIIEMEKELKRRVKLIMINKKIVVKAKQDIKIDMMMGIIFETIYSKYNYIVTRVTKNEVNLKSIEEGACSHLVTVNKGKFLELLQEGSLSAEVV